MEDRAPTGIRKVGFIDSLNGETTLIPSSMRSLKEAFMRRILMLIWKARMHLPHEVVAVISKRRRRDLNPQAGIADQLLSRQLLHH